MSPTESLTDSAFLRMRDMILSGELPSGTQLQERAFAERLGVSRTPVREAIARLMSEGLVIRAHRGVPTVNRISISEIMEILHIRRLLECEAAKQAARVSSNPEIWLNFKSTLAGYLNGYHPGAVEHADFDFAFHMQIANTAGSSLLAEMIGGLKLKTRIFDQGQIPDRLDPGTREHIAIADAILARDPDAAEMAMREHINNAREAILSHLHRLS
ncbi:GntR family transcriptional regulator [Roseovarius pelagicus]|uniref:GntR family transcriptional regulator n=1 Tax=Roseovarius pelagicus TaxID=2980108 RepID=A0ABY6D9G6_9RHOB|nr:MULTISPECIES: GntR family transcriptional regulator [Rhodobacterales]UXX82771.1 GntR family transcriptional regulator [Roseovarius pelagicus]